MDVGNISGWYPELVGRRQTEDNADMAIFQVERFKQLPSHPDEVWQGDLIRTPAWVTGEGKPYRALMPLWVAVKDDRVFPGAICKPHERNLGMAVEALVNFACDDAVGGYRPGRIEVRDAALAEHLDGLFGDADITISHVEELDALDRIKLDMARHMLGKEPSPSPLDGEGVTLERMHAFAEAAAAFYRAAPWQYLTNIDLLEIEKPDAPAGMSFATVLGAGGAMFGLGLYDTAQDSYRIGEDTMSDEMESEIRHRMWQMSFGPITDLPTYDPDLWEDHDLPVVGDEAYPYAWSIRPSSANGISGDTTSGDMTSGGGGSGGRQIKRPNAGELSYLEGILRAMAETTEQEIDTGRWRKKVQTFDGPIKFTLALPGLLDPPQHDELAQHGVMPDRRAMERMSAQMQRYFDEHPAKDMDEAKAMIQQQFVGKGPNDIDCPPRTPLEEAQELCYQAFETRGRRCVQLARQALEICSDCADACVILAEYAAGAETKLEFYTQGIAAGERALGQETFKNDVGHFWGILQTRPYMRSRLGLAQTLEQLGRLDAGGVVGVKMDRYPHLFFQDPHESASGVGLQEPRHVLDGQEMGPATHELLRQVDVVVERIALSSLVENVTRITDRDFADAARLPGRVDGHLHLLGPIQRIKNPKQVDAPLLGLEDELAYHVVGIGRVADRIRTAQQHLKQDVRNLLSQSIEPLPGILIEEAHGDVEGRPTPHLE